MVNHILTVRGRKASVTPRTLVQGTVGQDTLTLDLDSEWNGLNVTVTFVAATTEITPALTANVCEIPHEALVDSGEIDVFVLGTRDGKAMRHASLEHKMVVKKSNMSDGSTTADPSISAYRQAYDDAVKATEAANSAAGAAGSTAAEMEKLNNRYEKQISQQATSFSTDQIQRANDFSTAQTQRANDFSTAQTQRAHDFDRAMQGYENTFNEAEGERAASETERVKVEKERVKAEEKRAQDSKTRLEELAQAKTNAETATGEANTARDEAKKAATDATSAAGKATDAAGLAETAKTNANTAAGEAKSAATKAETAARKADGAAETAGTAASTAERAANKADTAAGNAESMAEKADASANKADIAAGKANEATVAATNAATKANEVEAKLTGNILKGKTNDTFIHVDDAFPSTLLGIEIEGACKQDGTPSPDNPVPIEVIEHPVLHVTGRNLLHYTDKAGKYNAQVGEKLDIPRTIPPLVFNGEDAHTDAKCNAWSCGHIFATEPLPAGTYYVSFNLWSDTGAGAVSKYITSSDYVIIKNLGNAKASGSGYTRSSPYKIVNLAFTVADGERLVVSVDVNDLGIDVGSVLHVTGATVCATRPTAYASYSGTSQAFTLPAEHPYLAKLPNGTADEIRVDKNGNVSLIANVEKRKISDDANWTIQDQSNGEFSLAYEGKDAVGLKKSLYASEMINDKLIPSYVWENKPCFGVSEVVWVVPRTNSKDITVAEVKQVVKDMVFYAPLAKSKTYNLGKIPLPALSESVSNVWTDAEITPRTGIEYTRDVNIVVTNLESAIASITEG